MSAVETLHDPFARECIVLLGIPADELHDRPCPACRELTALVDLDPDFGSAEDGRPCLRIACGCNNHRRQDPS